MDTPIGSRFLVEPAISVHFDAGWPFPKSSQGTYWASKNWKTRVQLSRGLLLIGGKRGSSWVVSDPSNSLRAEEVQIRLSVYARPLLGSLYGKYPAALMKLESRWKCPVSATHAALFTLA